MPMHMWAVPTFASESSFFSSTASPSAKLAMYMSNSNALRNRLWWEIGILFFCYWRSFTSGRIMFLGVVTVYLALCVALGWALSKVGIRPFDRLVCVCRKLGFRAPTCGIVGLFGGFLAAARALPL